MYIPITLCVAGFIRRVLLGFHWQCAALLPPRSWLLGPSGPAGGGGGARVGGENE